jgi:hypothetical protein
MFSILRLVGKEEGECRSTLLKLTGIRSLPSKGRFLKKDACKNRTALVGSRSRKSEALYGAGTLSWLYRLQNLSLFANLNYARSMFREFRIPQLPKTES